MPTADRYILTPNGLRYDKQTGWAEYKNDDGEWVRFTEDRAGANSRTDARLYGTSGYLGDAADVNAQNQDAWNQQMGGRDKSKFNVVKQNVGGGDAGDQWIDTYELKPEIKEKLGGKVQVSGLGSGGYRELIDPSKVEWSDEFGLVTDPSNIQVVDPNANNGYWGTAIMMALGGAAAVGGAGIGNMMGEAFGGAPATGGWESLGPGDGMTDPSGGGGWENLGPGDGMTDPTGGGMTEPYIEPPPANTGPGVPGPSETPTSTIPPDMQPLQPTNVGNLPPVPQLAANAGWSVPGWSALSPSAQRLVLQGLSSGASAAVSTRNASNAIDAANKRQEDDQDYRTGERERRGAPPAAIATVRPRNVQGGYAASGGLADKYMNRPRGG